MKKSSEKDGAREKLLRIQREYATLTKNLANIGFICVGTVVLQHIKCGKPSCPCATDDSARHGPYYIWSTKIKGRTVGRSLSQQEARLYISMIANRRRLDKAFKKMRNLSQLAVPLMVK